jgi:hypothetical protein
MSDKRKSDVKAGDATSRRAKVGEADSGQYQRFLDAVREHGCEENIGRLDEVVRRAAKLSPRREAAKPRKAKTKS